jgi:maleylacetoacetate isomerase
VRVGLALKGLRAEDITIDVLKGKQYTEDYLAVNPQGLVPALVLDEGGAPLFQSLAILEYLEETRAEPPLLPKDPRGRARVRGLSLIAAADGHPLVVPRVRQYLEKEMRQDEAARNRWLAHWTLRSLEAIEAHVSKEKETGRFCHGNTPTMADICLVSQMIGATAYFNCDTKSVPTAMRIYNTCMDMEAFAAPHPLKQPGASFH